MITNPDSKDEKVKYNVEVPKKLRPLLETIAKEVIRNQPNDIYAFTSVLVQELIRLKAENNGTCATESVELYAVFRNLLSAEARKRGLCLEKTSLAHYQSIDKDLSAAQSANPYISSQNPKIIEPKTQIKDNLDESVTKIQAGIRGYLTRKHLEATGIKVVHPLQLDDRCRSSSRPRTAPIHLSVLPPLSPFTKRSQSHEGIFEKSEVINNPDQAASKIQAGIRGFLTRKHLENRGIKVHHPDKSLSRSPSANVLYKSADNLNSIKNAPERRNSGNEVEAASKIQAGVRGFLTRKHLHEKGLPVHTPHEIHLRKMNEDSTSQKSAN